MAAGATDLDLTYVQIGLLLSLPGIVSSFVEPFIGILGDVGYRRLLVLGGGVAFAVALGLVSMSQGFIVLLIAWVVFYPASGAFVSLSQASLMDSAPSRREQNMVRWEFVGWVGYALGPLALMAAIAVGLGWRIAFLSMAAITVPAIIAVSRIPIGPRRNEPDLKAPSFVLRGRGTDRYKGTQAVQGNQVARAAAGVGPDARHILKFSGAVHGRRLRSV